MIVINGIILPPINGLTSRGFPGLSYFTPYKSSDFTPRITNDRLGLGPPKIYETDSTINTDLLKNFSKKTTKSL